MLLNYGMRALTITAIVSVAVIMVFGLLTPVLLQQAEAHIPGKIRPHFESVDGHDNGVRHDGCNFGQFGQARPIGAGLHYIDVNGNGEHDEQTERTLCLVDRRG